MMSRLVSVSGSCGSCCSSCTAVELLQLESRCSASHQLHYSRMLHAHIQTHAFPCPRIPSQRDQCDSEQRGAGGRHVFASRPGARHACCPGARQGARTFRPLSRLVA